MKYKCIAKCFVEDTVIMRPGDIIVMDGVQLYNVTTGVDYRNISDKERLMECLEAITTKDRLPITSKVAPTDDTDKFKEITDKMLDIFKKKNHDYGNSFELSLDEEGLAAARIRMGDKWNRFKTLTKNGSNIEVSDESLKDTLLDMANYAIITLIWMDKNK